MISPKTDNSQCKVSKRAALDSYQPPVLWANSLSLICSTSKPKYLKLLFHAHFQVLHLWLRHLSKLKQHRYLDCEAWKASYGHQPSSHCKVLIWCWCTLWPRTSSSWSSMIPKQSHLAGFQSIFMKGLPYLNRLQKYAWFLWVTSLISGGVLIPLWVTNWTVGLTWVIFVLRPRLQLVFAQVHVPKPLIFHIDDLSLMPNYSTLRAKRCQWLISRFLAGSLNLLFHLYSLVTKPLDLVDVKLIIIPNLSSSCLTSVSIFTSSSLFLAALSWLFGLINFVILKALLSILIANLAPLTFLFPKKLVFQFFL